MSFELDRRAFLAAALGATALGSARPAHAQRVATSAKIVIIGATSAIVATVAIICLCGLGSVLASA